MRSYTFAVVGAGFMGSTHVRAIQAIPGARVAVVSARTETTGRALAESCQADWTPDYREAVTRDDVDIVSICTPSGFHLQPAELAAQSGKQLIIEKPLEITVERADRILHAAEKAGVRITCIFPYRFHAGVAKTRAALARRRLGRLTLAGCYVKWYRRQDYYSGSWHGTKALDGGGALINQSIHSIDLLLHLAGPVSSVVGKISTLAHDMETEDTAGALLTFANGALGVIEAGTGCWPGGPARVEFHGERGTIVLVEGRITVWKIQGAPAGEEESMLALEELAPSGARASSDFSISELHRLQILDFLEAIQLGRQPLVDGREGRKAVEIVQAIYSSAAANKAVFLPL